MGKRQAFAKEEKAPKPSKKSCRPVGSKSATSAIKIGAPDEFRAIGKRSVVQQKASQTKASRRITTSDDHGRAWSPEASESVRVVVGKLPGSKELDVVDDGNSVVPQVQLLPTPPPSQELSDGGRADVGTERQDSMIRGGECSAEGGVEQDRRHVLYAVHHGMEGPWYPWNGTHIKGLFPTMREANAAAMRIYKEVCPRWTEFGMTSMGFRPSASPLPEVGLGRAQKWHNLQGEVQYAFHDSDFGLQYLAVVKHRVVRAAASQDCSNGLAPVQVERGRVGGVKV
ncbi:Hypothetical predicted protein [Lecanosticta acicola]|uniref:Uncharacterized protein n=1 Tax=Lecanosticta acicola TaxID=111012 RepID=A0AAI8YYL3_9PEZI|nr:Hypothetical predicted protein [Lecanosticta acicola]